MNTTRPRKSSCSPWPTPCARNIGQWWRQASYCRSTTPAYPIGGTC
jgi:hypothetical protein